MAIGTIRTSLALAAGMLLQGCGSESESGGPAAEENIAAPELVGRWQTDCVSVPGSSSTTTVTSASGGVIPVGGDTRRDTITFEQSGNVEFVSEYYRSSNCNNNTRLPAYTLNTVYYVGDPALDRNGLDVIELDYIANGDRVYSIIRIVGTNGLYIGDQPASTSGNDGSEAALRYDALGAARLDKQ